MSGAPTFSIVHPDKAHDITCAICFEPWVDPKEIQPCGHVFCGRCIERVNNCPECRGDIAGKVLPNRILVNMAKEIEMKCDRCGWKGHNENTHSHQCPPPAAPTPQASASASPSSTSPAPPPSYQVPPGLEASASSSTQGNSASSYPLPPAPGAPMTDPYAAPPMDRFQPPGYSSQQGRPPQPPPPPPAQEPYDPNKPWTKYQGVSQDQYDHIFAVFMTFDTDGSGQLDRAELTTLCRWLNFAHSRQDVDRMFREMDSDGSGSLDLDEFCTWLSRHRPDPQQLYGMNQVDYENTLFQFHTYDRDQNGYLEQGEFVDLCMKQGFVQSREEGARLFYAVDSDRSGHVDLHELLTYRAQHHQNGKTNNGSQQQQQQQQQPGLRRGQTSVDNPGVPQIPGTSAPPQNSQPGSPSGNPGVPFIPGSASSSGTYPPAPPQASSSGVYPPPSSPGSYPQGPGFGYPGQQQQQQAYGQGPYGVPQRYQYQQQQQPYYNPPPSGNDFGAGPAYPSGYYPPPQQQQQQQPPGPPQGYPYPHHHHHHQQQGHHQHHHHHQPHQQQQRPHSSSTGGGGASFTTAAGNSSGPGSPTGGATLSSYRAPWAIAAYCKTCNQHFPSPPKEWNCPSCSDKYRKQIKVWQGDDTPNQCTTCKEHCGMFNRHHCRCCGSLQCSKCSNYSAKVPAIGFMTPVKVCKRCIEPLAALQNKELNHALNHGTKK